MPSRFLRRDVPIAAALLTLAALIVAGVATGSFTRLRIARLVRDGGLAGPIRIHDAETVAALQSLEPAASDYLIAHVDEIEPDDLLTFANAVELIYERKSSVTTRLQAAHADVQTFYIPVPVTEDERLAYRCLLASELEIEHDIELPLPPAVHELLTRLLADAERFAAEPPPASDEQKIDWEKIFGGGSESSSSAYDAARERAITRNRAGRSWPSTPTPTPSPAAR